MCLSTKSSEDYCQSCLKGVLPEHRTLINETETEMIALRVLFCVVHDAQRTPKLCPRLLPTFKAWLLSTRSFCFNGELYGVF